MISILMPVKNEAKFLVECIDSIRSQSESDWELIAVDDHSADTSARILETYAKQDRRIKVLSNTGTGIIEALRTAYAASSGAYITRMDADDIMMPNKLELLINQLQYKPMGYVSTGLVQYFSESTLGNGYKRYGDWLNMLTKDNRNFDEIYKECCIPSPCWMCHRLDLDRIGAFNSDIYPEDYDLCFRWLQGGMKVTATDKIIHQWRDHPGRTSRHDPHYADQTFLDIKLHYFNIIHYNPNKDLILWGVGRKGKYAAKYFIGHNIPFQWISNNPNKIGHNIYNQIIQNVDRLRYSANYQLLIFIANPDEQSAIKADLLDEQLQPNINYFFFS